MPPKNSQKKDHEHWMDLALSEALKAQGKTSPNPLVGAVIVKNNRLLAKGFHRGPGKAHAEAAALKKVKQKIKQASSLKGATLYVTLEPCCHTGKRTPPCVPAVLSAGIGRVVIGMKDPNPQVAGRGIRQLRRAGLQVSVGVLQKECEALNLSYIHWMKTGTPWVSLKMAASLDGKIALANGRSQWISSADSRAHVHQVRSQIDAVLVGVGTVIQDNPKLNVRLNGSQAVKAPRRIILDPHLRTPLSANILKTKLNSGPAGETWIVTRKESLNSPKAKSLIKQGATLLTCPVDAQGSFRLSALLKQLGKREILSLLVEGGPGVWTEFLKQKVAHQISFYLAAQFLGADAKSLINPLQLKSLPGLGGFDFHTSQTLGKDVLLTLRKTSHS